MESTVHPCLLLGDSLFWRKEKFSLGNLPSPRWKTFMLIIVAPQWGWHVWLGYLQWCFQSASLTCILRVSNWSFPLPTLKYELVTKNSKLKKTFNIKDRDQIAESKKTLKKKQRLSRDKKTWKILHNLREISLLKPQKRT